MIDLIKQRVKDLEDHIELSLRLQKEYEEQQYFSNDPKDKARCNKNINDLKKLIAEYQQEYNQLKQQQSRGFQSTPIQPVSLQLEQITVPKNDLPARL